LRVEIHCSARRHQILDADIEHAYAHAVAWADSVTIRRVTSWPALTGPETSSSW